MDNYKPHAFTTSNTPNRIFTSTKTQPNGIDFFPAYLERKVADKRLGNFVVIFIYLKGKIFGKNTLCGNWLIERKIAKISVLNPFVNMIGGGGGAVVSIFIHCIITFFQISLLMTILNLLYSSILKKIASGWRHHSQGRLWTYFDR